MLQPEEVCLLVIDVQGKLAHIVHDAESVRRNVRRLILGADLLGLPVVATEQVPEKLGETTPEIVAALGEVKRLTKVTFSCWPDDAIREALAACGRKKVVVCGIEAHVCVYQTVRHLLDEGYEVELVTDAVSSRALANKQTAVARMAAEGAKLTATEMILFELQQTCEGDRFRQLSRLVK